MADQSYLLPRWSVGPVATAITLALAVTAADSARAQRFDVSANPFAGSPDSMQVAPLNEPLVSWILNFGHCLPLDSILGSREHGLLLTLVELPVFGTCAGTDAACEFRYLLTLQAEAEGYPHPVWDLGEHQRLQPVRWLPIDSTGNWWDDYLRAKLAIEVWPADTSRTRYIDELRGSAEAYVIDVTPESMAIRRR